MVFAIPFDLPWNETSQTAWTGDFKDSAFVKPWCNAANGSCGYWANDVYQPNYVVGSGSQIPYWEKTN
jgi:hypothetical protein